MPQSHALPWEEGKWEFSLGFWVGRDANDPVRSRALNGFTVFPAKAQTRSWQQLTEGSERITHWIRPSLTGDLTPFLKPARREDTKQRLRERNKTKIQGSQHEAALDPAGSSSALELYSLEALQHVRAPASAARCPNVAKSDSQSPLETLG